MAIYGSTIVVLWQWGSGQSHGNAWELMKNVQWQYNRGSPWQRILVAYHGPAMGLSGTTMETETLSNVQCFSKDLSDLK